jgi:hypothetical protein
MLLEEGQHKPMSQSDGLSNSEVETTARETLNRCGLLLD